jgi:hypothetical protein
MYKRKVCPIRISRRQTRIGSASNCLKEIPTILPRATAPSKRCTFSLSASYDGLASALSSQHVTHKPTRIIQPQNFTTTNDTTIPFCQRQPTLSAQWRKNQEKKSLSAPVWWSVSTKAMYVLARLTSWRIPSELKAMDWLTFISKS